MRWKKVQRRGKDTKVPVQLSGVNASVTDQHTWSSFADVARSVVGNGLGFVLGNGIACIDLDHCINGGKLSDVAQRVLSLVGDTFVEISPSGDGLHVWVKAPECAGRSVVVDGQPVEVYSRARYITVTGKQWKGSAMALAEVSSLPDFLDLLM